MSLTTSSFGFIVFLLSAPEVQSLDYWAVTYGSTEICAAERSTVEITCTYRYPQKISGIKTIVKEKFWFIKDSNYKHVDVGSSSVYAGRVQNHCDENSCTLRITDLRQRDSDVYYFRFITNQEGGRFSGESGVTLSVRVLHVKKKSGKRLVCESSCPPDRPSYIWYKNGHLIPGNQKEINYDSVYDDSYSCALGGREDFSSPSVCVNDRYCNKVIYTDRSICAFKGSSVDISCTFTSYGSITYKFWFSSESDHQWQSPSQSHFHTDSQFRGRVQVLEPRGGGGSTLRISGLTESDSGQYRFKFKAPYFEWGSSLPGTTLTVTDPDLQVLVWRSLSYPYWVYLKCYSSCRLPDDSSYIWYKNGEKITETLKEISDEYGSATYSCGVKGHEDFLSPSVCVDDQNCNRVIYTNRSICVTKGSSVDISCSYNSYGSITSKFWFRSESYRQWQSPSQLYLLTDSQFRGRVQVLESQEGGGSTLRISGLTESDSGQYRFKFKTSYIEWGSSLPGTTLTVTVLQVQVIRRTVQESYTEAELKCLSSCGSSARLSYVWFKNGQKVMEQYDSYTDQFNPGDVVSCALKGHEDSRSPSVYAPKNISVSVSPSGAIMENSSVTLTCSSDANPAANYTWYQNQKLMKTEPQLVFGSIQSSDSGEFYCRAENELGRTTSPHVTINVEYAPKNISVSVSSSGDIMEGSSVNLTCSSDAKPAAIYTWYKENQRINQGTEGIYHFSSISSWYRGTYQCTAKNKHGIKIKSTSVDVKYAPKNISVSVSSSGDIMEGSSVNLTCSSDANPAANYTWYKENERSLKASGQIFTITDLRPEHSGNYYCEVQNMRGRRNSTFHLEVSGKLTSGSIGTIVCLLFVVLLLILFGIILTRKKRIKQPSESGERWNKTEELKPTQSRREEQEDLQYASVEFCRNRSDPVYSNFTPAQPQRHEKDPEEDVEYSTVRFISGGTAPRIQEAEEDVTALYSTVIKTS